MKNAVQKIILKNRLIFFFFCYNGFMKMCTFSLDMINFYAVEFLA
jgi:hypothetical protein